MKSAARTAAWLLATALVLAPHPARAGEIEGVAFDERVRAGDTVLRLSGLGLLRYRFFFKAYVAALYLEPGTDASSALSDVPKRLEIHYFYGIRGPQFADAAEQLLERNLEPEQLARLRPRLDAFHALYQDVRPGDRYALTYVPGEGTELARNGVALGSAPGADFAAAYFSMWLGPDPLDDSLRTQLLGGR